MRFTLNKSPAAGQNTPAKDHNVTAELAALEKEAKRQQIAAQHAWYKLMEAQIVHTQPFATVILTATKVGVPIEEVQKLFDTSPSTFSRWASGQASPSAPLRTRLCTDLSGIAEKARENVNYPWLD